MAEKSEEDVRNETAQRLREIEALGRRARAQGLAFASLSEDEIAKKVRGESTGTPYIYAYEWIFKTSPGNPASFAVHISNPDPDGHNFVFVSVYFAVANFLDNQSYGEAAAHGNFHGNSQWPYLTSEPFNLTPGAIHDETFDYITPAEAPVTTYLGNATLWANQSLFGQGSYFDRCLFYVTLA